MYKKKINLIVLLFIYSFAFAVFLFGCSTNSKTTEASDETTNLVAIDNEIVRSWYTYGINSENSEVLEVESGKLLAITDKENFSSGFRYECSGGEIKIKRTFQTQETENQKYAIKTFEVNTLGDICESAFNAFKESCEKATGEFFSISDGCQNNATDAACRIAVVSTEEIKEMNSAYEKDAIKNCNEIQKGVETTTDEYETPSLITDSTEAPIISPTTENSTPQDSTYDPNYITPMPLIPDTL